MWSVSVSKEQDSKLHMFYLLTLVLTLFYFCNQYKCIINQPLILSLSPLMTVKTCKAEPVKWEASLRSSTTTKQDGKPSLVSPSSSSSLKASRSAFASPKTSRRVASPAAHTEVTKISSSSSDSSKWTGNFILMVELRRKIIAFRGIIDLPPLTGYLSLTNLLDHFYDALKSIGDSWIDDHEWIIKSKYKNSSLRKNLSDRLVEKVLSALDGLIKGMNERLNITEKGTEEKEEKVTTPPQSKAPLSPPKSDTKQPITPRTVLTPPGDISISVSNLPRNLRMQALVKLSPIDVKRLAIQNMCQKEAQSNSGGGDGDGDNESVKEKKSETKKMEKAKEAVLEVKDSEKNETDDKNHSKVPEKSETVPATLAPGNAAVPPPQPAVKGPSAPPPPPPKNAVLPPPPPLPVAAGRGSGAPPPPPFRLGAKKAAGKLKRSTQLRDLYNLLKDKIEGKDPQTPRGFAGGSKGGAESAPAREKESKGMADALAEITKKSAYFQQIEADVQMYMKAIDQLKTEIYNFQSKDMTELQNFHQYVESVLKNLTDETQVLKRCNEFPQSKLEAIRMAAAMYSKLQGMAKELKNWKIESPGNKLFDKTELNFKKASHWNTDFTLIKTEIEAIERIKVEEEKKFKSHNIHFDFSILVHIKESMVDVSSGCMELALKEKREAKMATHSAESRDAKPSMTKNKAAGSAKSLWRAFQFAYKVYTFAGGHDDRADQLTRELGDEIKRIL
ncbi:unnamed protein product [Thlaspi arvense]|uniref:Hydroxyproline-rich glycoprotein family protein n=1 Tax=Thlaspi arvense TaxID=13288 RepID=A0AAU9RCB7_THLAR|nr:unnamed protein product [Thlaspi arvense]